MAVGTVFSSIGLSACTSTSTGDNVSASLAMASSADQALPDTVSVLPTSFASNVDAPAAFAATAKATPAVGANATVAGAKPEAADAKTPVAATRTAAARAQVAVIDAKASSADANVTATPAVFTPNSFVKAEAPASDLDGLIAKYAAVYEVPVDLVRRVVKRESTFNPKAYNRGHWGLMQIKHATARGMGYNGPAKGLLDAETNLKYAVKYLKGAWLVANGNDDLADRLYQRGYYYDAKRKGLLDETGLGKDRRRRMTPPI
jgi:soluble lytic murein transglycosylase-like protein